MGRGGGDPEGEGGWPRGSPPNQAAPNSVLSTGLPGVRSETKGCPHHTSLALEGSELEPWDQGGLLNSLPGAQGPAQPLHCSSMLGA